MNSMKILLSFILFFLMLIPATIAEDFVDVKTELFSFSINPYKVHQLENTNMSESTIYVNLDKEMQVKNYMDLFNLDIALLNINILPLDNFVIYIEFPDGGKMLMLLDDKINHKKLINMVDKILINKKKEAYLMKMMGWKPRIDWLVINSLLTAKEETIKLLVDKFNIKEIIVPSRLNYSFLSDTKQLKLNPDEQINLLQTISPAKIVSYGTNKINEKFLIFRLSYTNFSFLFLPNITETEEREMINKYSGDIATTVVLTKKPIQSISEEFLSTVKPGIIISKEAKMRLSTGGHLLYMKEYSDE